MFRTLFDSVTHRLASRHTDLDAAGEEVLDNDDAAAGIPVQCEQKLGFLAHFHDAPGCMH